MCQLHLSLERKISECFFETEVFCVLQEVSFKPDSIVFHQKFHVILSVESLTVKIESLRERVEFEIDKKDEQCRNLWTHRIHQARW